jgi:integrase
MNTVDAISKDEIGLVTTLLNKRYGPLYADIWKVGLNLSLRISDLLSLRYDQLDLEGRALKLIEQKTGKSKAIRLNQTVIDIIQRRRDHRPGDVWLFQVHSNRDKNKPVSRISVSKAFKDVGDTLGLSINTHAMRKSRGKALYDAGVSLEQIAKVLNHSSPAVTMRYIGLTHVQTMATYDEFQL